jgi:hypothetical protein
MAMKLKTPAELLLVLLLALMTAACAGQSAPGARTPEARATSSTPPSGPAAPAPIATQPAAAARPLQGDVEAGRTYSVGAAGKNQNVELTVTDLQLMDSGSGRLLVLTTVWKNLVPPKAIERPKSGPTGTVSGETETVVAETPYLVPDLPKHLHLLIDNRYVAHLDPATGRLPEALPSPRLMIERYDQEVRGTVAFAVPTAPFRSLALQFYDFTQGHITLPVYGAPPAPAERPVAGPARNQILAASVYGAQNVAEAGTAQAPADSRFLLVDVGVTSLAPGQIAQVDLTKFVYLIEDGVYQYRPAAEIPGLAHQFHGMINFLPEFERRGQLAFVVPAQTGRLELLISAARIDPLSLVVTPDIAARPQPQPEATIQDGDVAEILINDARLLDSVAGEAAPAGERFLVLDVTAVNKSATQGVAFQPGQFSLTGSGRQFAYSPATTNLRHGLAQERVVPARSRARFEVAFAVPSGGAELRVRYQGFTTMGEAVLR